MNNLPNLSEWHEVPRGATIPEGTLWAVDFGHKAIGLYTHSVDTSEYTTATMFYTAEPIARSLAQVIEAAYNRDGDEDWEAAARAARDFLTPKVPEYVIDGDNDKWVLNDGGTYDCLYATDSGHLNRTLDYIRGRYGVQED